MAVTVADALALLQAIPSIYAAVSGVVANASDTDLVTLNAAIATAKA